MMLNVVYNQHF